MTTAVSIVTPKSPKPSHSVPFQKNANKRWPPMANRNALPYKLTVISKEKLAREATAPDPSLRRCVAHFRLHCGSVLWTENDMKSRISSFEFEETDEEDEAEDEKQEESPKFVNGPVTGIPSEQEMNAAQVTETEILAMDSKNFCCVSVTPIAA
ncbi:uncharacterized protein N7498_000638 [Penicillium cinerascens]|uniref:Uncharacterized protein n=1 Tax=Penicillium cinerascens TaxID=70096 RepID=A0A9W9TDL6_9EURO|nr:uncharacterized protein N7498_000638 [Penicillium cinerascens]KAJ5218539.1 hypothetical protein N7498_000638 [Penicillium cinerascens]